MDLNVLSTSGETWGNVTWPVPPTPTGPGYEMARGGNPTVIFDSKRQNVVLHFNRGKKPSQLAKRSQSEPYFCNISQLQQSETTKIPIPMYLSFFLKSIEKS